MKVEARLILSRDQTIGQPLPVVEAAKIDQAAAAISKSYQAAREQLAAEKNCYTLFREGKHDEADPDGALCAVEVSQRNDRDGLPGERIQSLKQRRFGVAVSERITAVDPRTFRRFASRPRSTRSARIRKRCRCSRGSWLPIRATTSFASRSSSSLDPEAARRRMAVPIVEEAIAQNPGDPKTLNIAWRVYLAANQFEKALTTGARDDSSGHGGCRHGLLHPKRCCGVLNEPDSCGADRLPGNREVPVPTSSLLVVQANTLSKAGQNPQALAAINRALADKPESRERLRAEDAHPERA